MKHAPTSLPRYGFFCMAILGAALASPLASAQLQTTPQFAAMDEDDVVVTSETVAAEEIQLAAKPRSPRNVIIVDNSSNSTDSASAQSATEAPTSATPGSRISRMIDGKLDENRRRYEEEAKRKQKEDEDRLVSRFEQALTEEHAPAPQPVQPYQQQAQVQPQPQPVQTTQAPQAISTVDEEYAEAAVMKSEAKAATASNRGSFTIAPHIGLTSLSVPSNYTSSSGVALGLSGMYSIDDNLAVIGSYTYAEHDITLKNGGSTFNSFNQFSANNFNNPNYLNNNLNKLEYSQNIFDGGLRYTLFSREASFRPYFGGGGGYMRGYLNYPQQTLNNSFAQNPFNNTNGQLEDYEVGAWFAYLALGTNIQFSDNFGLGLNYRYNILLSATENTKINNYGFVNNGFNQGLITDKEIVGGSLRDSNFHMFNASLNLTF